MVEVVEDDGRTVVNAYDVVEAISVPVVVFSPFIEEIEVLVRAVGASVLMVEVLNGSIVSDTDVTVDEKSVGVILTWVVSVVMASCVIDSAVDSVSDTLIMGSVVMIVEISAALDGLLQVHSLCLVSHTTLLPHTEGALVGSGQFLGHINYNIRIKHIQ